MIVPIVSSLFAEIVPTWPIMLPLTGLDIFFKSATMASTAFSMPRLSSIGFAPATTILMPSRKIACASTVAVVVPSPAVSDVLLATSRTELRCPLSIVTVSGGWLRSCVGDGPWAQMGAESPHNTVTAMTLGQPRTLLLPSDAHWEKCARHQNTSTTRFVANFFLCDDCCDRLQLEVFNGRPPLFEGLHVEGYCGLCNQLTATDLRQWFVCPICVNVVLSYPKGFAASRYVHEFWNREIKPAFPELELEELDEVRLEPFVHGRRSAKTKAQVVQALDYRVSRRDGDSLDPVFCIELKAGPAAIPEMKEFQLDVNDFNDIANSCNNSGLPAYVFHVQINDDYRPPTRRSVAKDLWWTDVWSLDSARKAVRQRRGEDKRAAYFKPSVFQARQSFVSELAGKGFATLRERLRDCPIELL
jgi:hypothetical protein